MHYYLQSHEGKVLNMFGTQAKLKDHASWKPGLLHGVFLFFLLSAKLPMVFNDVIREGKWDLYHMQYTCQPLFQVVILVVRKSF